MAMTPMMTTYLKTKEQYPDCILFYRLGDFYEMFYDDAKTASKELGLALTGKDCGMPERAPMCGVPYHAVDQYLTKLVENGHKVAIAEQMEDPKLAKGLVKREVIRVVTPGTLMDQNALDESKNHYILCIAYVNGIFGIAVSDVTTGDFFLLEAESRDALYDEIWHFQPSEIVYNEAFLISGADLRTLSDRMTFSSSLLESSRFTADNAKKVLLRHFEVQSLESLGADSYFSGTIAAGALLSYLLDTQKNELRHITKLTVFQRKGIMVLDRSTRRNLELTETMREGTKRGTLFWVLDKTRTAMGARTLHRMIEEPLIDRNAILDRQSVIRDLMNTPVVREELREYLNPVYDLERLLGRISYGTANPRDLIAFSNSIAMIPPIRLILQDTKSEYLARLRDELDPLDDLQDLVARAIREDAPILVHDGGIINDGYNEQVDQYRKARTEGRSWLASVEEEEREKTGIKNLRVRFNKVFGYYLEVTNSYKDLVPDYFERKQTLVGAERYITPRLKELEDMILGAEDKLNALEFELFKNVRDTIAEEIERIQKTAEALASIDALASLAHVAERNEYVCPKINEKGVIHIKNGRHPVVERMQDNDRFVPNDTLLDSHDNRVLIITGPNMAGKSTYMRQTALITLMAQMGSFVPAEEADISICDRIFTRVGASDDLASGQSTFMVEMTEVANILRNATRKSLVILDEIGRGTSTFDGMSIAWAVVEYIANPKIIGAKTLFATHYHELTELEGAVPGVKNYCISVKEQGDTVIFLRKIVPGGADKSYGIQVARLAGVPKPVLTRADEPVLELVDTDIAARAKEIAGYAALGMENKKRVERKDEVEMNQLTFRDAVPDEDILRKIGSMDLTRMTPLDALNTLHNLQAEINNRT